MRKNSGQAAILIIFVLGMIVLLVGLFLTQTGFQESLMGRAQVDSGKAFYAAQTGVEDALYQINHGLPKNDYQFSVGESKVKVEISGDSVQKTINSAGNFGPYWRYLKVVVQKSGINPAFPYAVHAGQGGFELEHNTVITGKNNTVGNVYSNHWVWAAKNDYWPASGECKKAASKIDGTVWAVEGLTKLGKNDSGACVTKKIYTGLADYCFVKGDVFASIKTAKCPTNGNWHDDQPAPELMPLPEVGLAEMRAYLQRPAGKVWPGHCILNGGPSDCSGGTNNVGDLIIEGNLRKPSNANLVVTDAIWVKGKVIFESLGRVEPIATAQSGKIILADGPIEVASNVTFGTSNGAFLLFVSTAKTSESELCNTPAISLSSNTNSVLFYASKGCVLVTANSTFHGAIIGERIHVANNSLVEYDPELLWAPFGWANGGGWQTVSYAEE